MVVGGEGWLAGKLVGYDGVRGGPTRALEETAGVYERRGGGMVTGCELSGICRGNERRLTGPSMAKSSTATMLCALLYR